jgi:hypothetical protein
LPVFSLFSPALHTPMPGPWIRLAQAKRNNDWPVKRNNDWQTGALHLQSPQLTSKSLLATACPAAHAHHEHITSKTDAKFAQPETHLHICPEARHSCADSNLWGGGEVLSLQIQIHTSSACQVRWAMGS